MRRKLYGDPETSTVVVTANGEVETNQDTQVYVHDLGPFVTVKLLEDMPAVLSIGKLAKNTDIHRVGQRSGTTVDQKAKDILMQNGQFRQVQTRSEVTNTHQETGVQKYKQNEKRNDSRDSDHRLRDLPEWLEEFTDYPEDIRIARARTRFPGLTHGTSNECGIEVKGAQYFLTSQRT